MVHCENGSSFTDLKRNLAVEIVRRGMSSTKLVILTNINASNRKTIRLHISETTTWNSSFLYIARALVTLCDRFVQIYVLLLYRLSSIRFVSHYINFVTSFILFDYTLTCLSLV